MKWSKLHDFYTSFTRSLHDITYQLHINYIVKHIITQQLHVCNAHVITCYYMPYYTIIT